MQAQRSDYTYDQVGNRLTYNSKYGKITYEYDKSSNRLNRVNFNRENNDLSYMLINYDANGNTLQRDYFRNKDEIFEQELYEYNNDNMMTHYVRHKPVMKNNRIEMEVESELNMKYDVNGTRVIKECYPNTNDSTIYIYEGGEVILEMTYEQIPKHKHLFTYAGGKKVSRISFNNNQIDLDSRKYFHQNFLGSIAMITDKDGNIEEHNKYEPFGDIIWSKSYIDTDNNYKFTGKERDKESNLDYFNARYLDTKLGRFIKADILTGNINNPQTLNRWVYCINNPIKYTDPTGMEINITGPDADSATDALNKVDSTYKIRRDPNSGRLYTTQNIFQKILSFLGSGNDAGKELKKVIESNRITVNLQTVRNQRHVLIGAFFGSQDIIDPTQTQRVVTVADQRIDMGHVRAIEDKDVGFGPDVPSTVLWEVMEAYYGARDYPGEPPKWQQRPGNLDPNFTNIRSTTRKIYNKYRKSKSKPISVSEKTTEHSSGLHSKTFYYEGTEHLGNYSIRFTSNNDIYQIHRNRGGWTGN